MQSKFVFYKNHGTAILWAKGAQRDNPDVGQFRAAFRQVIVPSTSANCEADADSFTCSLKHMKEAPSTSTEHESRSVMDQVLLSVKVILFVCTPPDEEMCSGSANQENNVLANIARHIVRAVKVSLLCVLW